MPMIRSEILYDLDYFLRHSRVRNEPHRYDHVNEQRLMAVSINLSQPTKTFLIPVSRFWLKKKKH